LKTKKQEPKSEQIGEVVQQSKNEEKTIVKEKQI
jgi:hypothetical protein